MTYPHMQSPRELRQLNNCSQPRNPDRAVRLSPNRISDQPLLPQNGRSPKHRGQLSAPRSDMRTFYLGRGLLAVLVEQFVDQRDVGVDHRVAQALLLGDWLHQLV